MPDRGKSARRTEAGVKLEWGREARQRPDIQTPLALPARTVPVIPAATSRAPPADVAHDAVHGPRDA